MRTILIFAVIIIAAVSYGLGRSLETVTAKQATIDSLTHEIVVLRIDAKYNNRIIQNLHGRDLETPMVELIKYRDSVERADSTYAAHFNTYTKKTWKRTIIIRTPK